ncbi:MAG: bifunctional riboflavin kinase/FAD synthetase [Desulfovibrio sp.]|jgi:riboflavin kinase/FMN adenylyltransferase|nr:bifunctional riboflavin kinase/FAD synthetase [Desulfovibrio sp.]
MRIASSVEDILPLSGTGVTIGNFDGVHLGHQALIRRALELCREKNLGGVLVTFTPHPRCVLASQRHIPLAGREERMKLLAALGVENVLELPFTPDMAVMSAEEFIRRFLLALGMRRLVVGYDFSLGKNRGGSIEVLRGLGPRYGFTLERLAPVLLDDGIVSSTRLRRMIARGDVRGAGRLLGRRYGFSGEVAHGDKRGAGLGYPTVNLAKPEVLLPGDGVYATFMRHGSRCFPAVTNVGQRPTFGGGTVTVESFLPGESVNLYGQSVSLEFVERLREERRFESAEHLGAQIARDAEHARAVLSAEDPPHEVTDPDRATGRQTTGR